ncbi:MAG: hypothetical protein Q9191_001051 [Dirinaria sp. TL-2023a]
MSSSPLIMITGGNGFIGYAVLAAALKAGFRVRAVVRRQDAVDTISRGPSVQEYLATGALTFAIVPDNTKPSAYFEAAKDCSYIIHVASPLPTVAGDLVSPAVAGNKAVLEAAEATPSVRRVIFTASTSGLHPFGRLFPEHPLNQALTLGRSDEVAALTAETRVPNQPLASDDAPGFHRYVNSKIASTNLVHDYALAKIFETSHFSIVNLMPGWVLGPEELARNRKEAFLGSNLVLGWLFSDQANLTPLLGFYSGHNPPAFSLTVHLDDVVESHIKSLDTEIVLGKYRSFLLASGSPRGPIFMDAADIVRKELPKEVADGKIPFAGKLDTLPIPFDATPTERDLLGHPFRSFEEQVTETIKWYVGLSD